MSGQLYIANTTATLPTGEIVKSRYVLIASDRDDVERQLRYALNLAIYRAFSITRVERAKPNIYKVWSQTEQAKERADFVDKQGDAHYQRTNQQKNKSTFAVGIVGTISGADENHVLRRLGGYLQSKGIGDIKIVSPMHSNEVIRIEELGESDATVLPDLENIFTHTTIFRGGATGLKR